MISAAHPRLHRLPAFLGLTCAVGMSLSSCSMFHKNSAPPSSQPPVYQPSSKQRAAQQPQAPRAPKVAKTALPGAPAITPVAPPSGPVPKNQGGNFSTDVPSNTPKSVSSVPVSGKYIAITFDDGPSAANTPRLLAMLRERNIKATFFCVGENVDAHPGIAKQIVAEGHEIGNHSYSHPLFTKLGDDAFQSQITRTHDAIVRATGVTPTLMRPPYGATTPAQKEWLNSEYHYHVILWSVDPLDWKRPGSAAVTSRILAQTKQGGIILAHDIHGQTVDAMPATLDALLRRGYQFVTVSQLLAMRTGG
jgi:peptidoglycan/xylan/chitin deacetylase (PgdA/CDA1 family)